MNPFDHNPAFWRRHHALALLIFGCLILLAVAVGQLDQTGAAVVYQGF